MVAPAVAALSSTQYEHFEQIVLQMYMECQPCYQMRWEFQRVFCVN